MPVGIGVTAFRNELLGRADIYHRHVALHLPSVGLSGHSIQAGEPLRRRVTYNPGT